MTRSGRSGPSGLGFPEGRACENPVDSTDVRNVVVLQLVMLLNEVGLHNVRVCGACPRLFVKTYRREFCSVQCQQRKYKRIKRQWTKEQKERQAAARRRRKVRA